MIHRQLPSSPLRRLAAFAALATVLVVSSMAQAQSAQQRGRQLYNEGRSLFEQGKYTQAIDKFRQADQIAPAPLLDFNIGLAYDRMGDRANAIKYYRTYLDRAPSAQNRDAVQAKINRLQGELREEATRKAAEQKAAQEAAAKKAADEEAARKAAGTTPPAAGTTPPAAGTTPPAAGTTPPAAVGAPPQPPTVDEPGPASDGTAGNGAAATTPPAPDPFASTGDPELDRVSHIDVGAIRAQRGLASSPGPAEQAPGPDGAQGGAPDRPAAPPPLDDGHRHKAKPLYKQWWFWVVLGVSAVILIDIATTGNNSNAQPGALMRQDGAPSTGPVLLRF